MIERAHVAALAALFVVVDAGCAAPMVMEDAAAASSDAGFDASSSRDAGTDAGQDGHFEPPADPCPDGCVGAGCLRGRCADEPIPGFRLRPDGLYQPCNCFELDDAMQPIPVPTRCSDQGVRTVTFDCSWPEGMIFHRGYLHSGPVELGSASCEHSEAAARPEGFYPAPYEQLFVAYDFLDPRLPRDRVCVPRECVFDTPGERARCSTECDPSWSDGYTTVYRVDRSACAGSGGVGGGPSADAAPGIDGGP